MNKTPKKEKTFFETYDLYSDANPYKNKKEVKETINKLEKLYKDGKRPHNRIVQIANVMTQRLRVIKDKNPSIDKGRLEMSKKYFEFLKSRTKKKKDDDRKKMKFIF
jgi:hypothetical protein